MVLLLSFDANDAFFWGKIFDCLAWFPSLNADAASLGFRRVKFLLMMIFYRSYKHHQTSSMGFLTLTKRFLKIILSLLHDGFLKKLNNNNCSTTNHNFLINSSSITKKNKYWNHSLMVMGAKKKPYIQEKPFFIFYFFVVYIYTFF